MKIRKVPLAPLIQILTDLFDSGADFIDISGENNAEGEAPRDLIKINIMPEYMTKENDENEEEDEYSMIEEIQMDYSELYEEKEEGDDNRKSFSDEDIDNLI